MIRSLSHELETNGIAYCLWKGTYSFQGVLSGEKDVDLLVRRADYSSFVAALSRLGFREAYSPGQRPSVVHHYYGHDSTSEHLLHVHSTSTLLLGHQATGVYALPLEDLYLRSAMPGELFKIPPAELELLVFVVRMMLWQSPTVLLPFGRKPTLPSKRGEELAYLLERADLDRLRELVEQHLPHLGLSSFELCVRVLQGAATRRETARCWKAVRRVVTPWPYCSDARKLFQVLWGRGLRTVRRWARLPRRKRRLIGGGAMIAFIGGDGAGKSTAIESVRAWLDPHLDVRTMHFGKPPWSLMTLVIRRWIRAIKRLSTVLGRDVPKYDKRHRDATQYSVILRHVCTARDRYLQYQRSLRATARGEIVLCDRFPTTQPVGVDGPRLTDLLERATERRSLRVGLKKTLARVEARYYSHIGDPDLLMVFKLDPDLAVARKAEEGADWVWSRNAKIWNADWGGPEAEVIDASQPVAVVRSLVRERVWSHM